MSWKPQITESFRFPAEECGEAGMRPHSFCRRGYVLVALSISLMFLLAAVGLGIDIGRMYVIRSEAQSFADAAALSAAQQLDETASGITRARTAASSHPKHWEFGSFAFTDVQTTFATASTGPWTATPPDPPTGYHFVQVVARANAPMFLVRVVTGSPLATVAAAAIAGREVTSGVPGGEFPFSPYTRVGSPDDASDPFGMQVGNQYTLRWGAPGTRSNCGSDATQPTLAQEGSVRGYCCVAQSASGLREAIVSGKTDPVVIGQPISMDGTVQSEMTAIAQRVILDTDSTSTDYAHYRAAGQGNGFRVVMVAVNGGPPNYLAVGFAGFFLLNYSYYDGLRGGNDSACAEYMGAWVQGARDPGAAGSGAFHLKLFQ